MSYLPQFIQKQLVPISYTQHQKMERSMIKVDNMLFDLKNKIRRAQVSNMVGQGFNPANPSTPIIGLDKKRNSFEYTAKQAMEIHKMFYKFKKVMSEIVPKNYDPLSEYTTKRDQKGREIFPEAEKIVKMTENEISEMLQLDVTNQSIYEVNEKFERIDKRIKNVIQEMTDFSELVEDHPTGINHTTKLKVAPVKELSP